MERGNLEWPEQVKSGPQTSCRRPGSISPAWLWRLLNPAMSVKSTRDKGEKSRHGCVGPFMGTQTSVPCDRHMAQILIFTLKCKNKWPMQTFTAGSSMYE